MRRCILGLLLLSVFVLWAAPANAAQAILAVRQPDTGRSPVTLDMVAAMIASDGVLNSAVGEAFDTKGVDWRKKVQVQLAPIGPDTLSITLTVLPEARVEDPEAVASQVIDGLLVRTQSGLERLVGADQATTDSLAEANDELTTLSELQTAEEEQVREMQANLARRGGRPTSRQSVEALRAQLAEQAKAVALTETLSIEFAKLQSEVAGADGTPTTAPADTVDPVTAAQQSVVDAQRELVAALEKAQPRDPVKVAEAKLELAKLELTFAEAAERRGALISRNDTNRYERQLIDQKMQVRDTEIRIAELEKTLTDDTAEEVVDPAALDKLRQDVGQRDRRINKLRRSIQVLETQLRQQPMAPRLVRLDQPGANSE